MPILLSVLEPNIILGVWIDPVTTAEIKQATADLIVLADSQGLTYYVNLADFRNCTKVPFDMMMLRERASQDRRIIAYVILGGNTVINVAARMLMQLIYRPFVLAKEMPEAEAMARKQLHDHQHKTGLHSSNQSGH